MKTNMEAASPTLIKTGTVWECLQGTSKHCSILQEENAADSDMNKLDCLQTEDILKPCDYTLHHLEHHC